MSEELQATSPDTIDPFAASLALSGASREKADAFLEDQRHHIHEQLKQIHLDIWEKWLGVLLRLATLCVGIAAAAGIGLMVWEAAHSNGLLIEPFLVPSDMAAKGLTGQVIASQLLDKLTTMQNLTVSNRPPQSYANNWGNDIKVEIPETGVSIGEFQRFLRGWLGHDTHITGEIWRTGSDIAVTARAGNDSGAIFTGPETALGDLLQKAAEHVYGSTQPYRYANFLDRNSLRPGAPLRIAEAEAIYRKLIHDPNPVERAWAWNGLANLSWSVYGNVPQAAAYYRKAVSIMPEFGAGYGALGYQEMVLNHPEAELAARKTSISLASTSGSEQDRYRAALLGDFALSFEECQNGIEQPDGRAIINRDFAQDCAAMALANQHDGMAVRSFWRELPPLQAQVDSGRRALYKLKTDAALQHWQAVLAAEPEVERIFVTFYSHWDLKAYLGRAAWPMLALAKARLGDLKGAEALIGKTPADCYDCMRVRAIVAAAGRQDGRSDYWFARATESAPSIPFAHADWGKALLARGKPDNAIAQFRLANRRGPHFADPLEGWGEALMAKNQSHLALAKFAEADKYAPNWGRLHLKWGEALSFAGRRDEARAQFARAGQLDLTLPEKSELARMAHG